MRRTIPILRGLAILGVIFNHANWHALSRFAAGDVKGYPFLAFDQIGKFAIPAFMAIAGYFIAYATSGGKRDLSWQVVRARLVGLLWPWLIWSAIMMIGQFVQGRSLSLAEFVRTLFIHYYFIPLLILYYLLAPLVVKLARSNVRGLLVGAAVVQLLTIALFYARVYHPLFPGALKSWVDLGPLQYLRFAFYFPFGVVCGMFSRATKNSLTRFKSVLPWLTLIFFGLAVVETMMAYNLGGNVWPTGGDQTKLSSALFSTALVFCFVIFDKLTVPSIRTAKKLGAHSYGLYLCHYPILGIIAKVIERVVPGVASQGWLLLSLLFVLTVAFAMLLMEGVSKLPAKRFYRYLFG
ncbi:MAG: acyltransferase [Chloroflexi bacterium]|nr:acyltransferase [Chloroflexota bacterium]